MKRLDLYMLFMGRPQCIPIEEIYVPDKHLHKEIECAYMQEGSLQIQVDGHLFTIEAGEMLVIGGNVLHQFKPTNRNEKIIKLKFLKEWILPPYATIDEAAAIDDVFASSFKTKPDPHIARLIEQMLSDAMEEQHDFYVYSKMLELAAYLVARPHLIIEKFFSKLEYPRYLDELTQYIHRRFNEKLTLQMLSKHLGLTESYCSRYIKKHTGLSFVEYLSAIRVNYAQQLLSYTDESISEVIDATGFFSVQTFNRVFKQQTGKTPTEYRRAQRTKTVSVVSAFPL